MKKILTISNQKGGVAKSTTCSQVGGYLASRGIRTLLIDLDPQANLSSKFLKMDASFDGGSSGFGPPEHENGNTYTSRELFFGPEDTEWDTYKTATNNLWILPSSNNMFDMNQYPTKALDNFLKWMDMEDLWGYFDAVIIDTPPAKNLYSEAALTAATHVLIPCPMEKAPFEGLMAAIQFIQMVNGPLAPDEMATTIGILPTMFRSTTAIHKSFLRRLEKSLGAHATPFQIKYRPTYQEIDMVAKQEPYEIRNIAKTRDAYLEWKTLGEFVIKKMGLK